MRRIFGPSSHVSSNAERNLPAVALDQALAVLEARAAQQSVGCLVEARTLAAMIQGDISLTPQRQELREVDKLLGERHAEREQRIAAGDIASAGRAWTDIEAL